MFQNIINKKILKISMNINICLLKIEVYDFD